MRPESARRIDAANNLHDAQARYRSLRAEWANDPHSPITAHELDAAVAQCDAAREALDAAHRAEDEAIAAESA